MKPKPRYQPGEKIGGRDREKNSGLLGLSGFRRPESVSPSDPSSSAQMEE